MEPKTLRQLLYSHRNDAIAFKIRTETGFRQYSYNQVIALCSKVQNQLKALGVRPRDKVAILSQNCPEWPIAYLAITGMGAVAVPLDATLSRENIANLLDDSGSKAIILSNEYSGFSLTLPQLLMEQIENLAKAGADDGYEVMPHDLAAIVYTSGTTGMAKGVMLTHANIMSNVIASASIFDVSDKDVFLSVLPLSHTFETTGGFLVPFFSGSSIVYAESLKSYNLLRNLQECGVTVMCGVPLLYQLFYDGILRAAKEQGKEKIFCWLLKLSAFIQRVTGINIGKRLFSSVHAKFGKKLRFFISGGAAIDPGLIKKFQILGFTILQGYGLTESSPVLTACSEKENRIGSVGKAIPGVQLSIAGTGPVGEILACGPNIMQGYYKRKDLTDKVIINQWLYTGDVGCLDQDGFLFITGRLKDVIVTAAGVNVYPEEVEFSINKSPAVLESCVLGSKIKEGVQKGGEEVFAIIVPKMEYFEALGNTALEYIEKTINYEVSMYNKGTADFRRIKRFEIRLSELPKTRLKKIKRFELQKELKLNYE